MESTDNLFKMLAREMKRQENIDAREEYQAYDDMDNMKWKLPDPLSGMLEMRVDIDSAPHDHLKTGCDIFNTHTPQIDILPLGPADVDFAKEREIWAEWQVAQSNRRGEGDWTRQLLEHSLKYSRICAQVDYLPYWLPEESLRTKEQKAIAALGGDFCVTLFHPSAIYNGSGKYGLTWTASVQVMSAADVAGHWSAYISDKHPTIKKAVAKLRELETKCLENIKLSVEGSLEVKDKQLDSSKWVISSIMALDRAASQEESMLTKLRLEGKRDSDDEDEQEVAEIVKLVPRLKLTFDEPEVKE